jgi:hypothetical protein
MTVCGTHERTVYLCFSKSVDKGEEFGQYAAIFRTNRVKSMTETLWKTTNQFDTQNQYSVRLLARYDRFFLARKTANANLLRQN